MSQKAVEAKKQSPKLSPELKSLEVLVGEWKEETTFKNDPDNSGTAKASFEWMDGKFFMIWRFAGEYKKHGPHNGICVIGYDDAKQSCVGHFFDNLGYARVYQVSVKGDALKITGEHERFTAKFGEGGKSLTGTWEQSDDGSNWKYLCDVKQTKIK